MPRQTQRTKRTQQGKQRQNAAGTAAPANDATVHPDNGNLNPEEINFRDRRIGGVLAFKRRKGHHCLFKDAAKTHKWSPQCITKGHEGWCPECAHLVHGRSGCRICRVKKADLFFDTNEFTRWLMIKEARQAATATTATNNK
ncbi:hypothetical protein H2200_008869 [Cladophialophora chaetospira]|uniref:Uncharacterized protein n=1 Tax=Cladophialophora chaetospira TaxID=386627 RepID=A0AA38X4T6_9EURO|nr:hypothetical protein H2200_008869 [Cladophialophora chaetospira]